MAQICTDVKAGCVALMMWVAVQVFPRASIGQDSIPVYCSRTDSQTYCFNWSFITLVISF